MYLPGFVLLPPHFLPFSTYLLKSSYIGNNCIFTTSYLCVILSVNRHVHHWSSIILRVFLYYSCWGSVLFNLSKPLTIKLPPTTTSQLHNFMRMMYSYIRTTGFVLWITIHNQRSRQQHPRFMDV